MILFREIEKRRERVVLHDLAGLPRHLLEPLLEVIGQFADVAGRRFMVAERIDAYRVARVSKVADQGAKCLNKKGLGDTFFNADNL